MRPFHRHGERLMRLRGWRRRGNLDKGFVWAIMRTGPRFSERCGKQMLPTHHRHPRYAEPLSQYLRDMAMMPRRRAQITGIRRRRKSWAGAPQDRTRCIRNNGRSVERAAQLLEGPWTPHDQPQRQSGCPRALSEAEDTDKLSVMTLSAAGGPSNRHPAPRLRRWASDISGIPDWLFEASYHVVGDFATVAHIATLEAPIEKDLTSWVLYVERLRKLPEADRNAW